MAKDPFDKVDGDPFAEAEGLFDKPTTSFEQLAVPENLGKLMLVTPTGFREKVMTRFTQPGQEGSDAVEADAVVFEEDGSANVLEGTLIFQKVIIGQLKGRIGKGKPPVLAVLAKRKSTERGRSDAWLLDPDVVTADQVKQAKAYLLESQQVGRPDEG